MRRFQTVRTQDQLLEVVRDVGFLPFFANPVPGWSVEEHTDPSVWFTDQAGPWDWKGPLASRKEIVYGKFFRRKAAFISPDYFPYLASFRREGLTFQEQVEDGTVPRNDIIFMEYLNKNPGIRSSYLKRILPFAKGFDTVSARLQMQTYAVIQDFVYDIDHTGKPYGWGKSTLINADQWLGSAFSSLVDALDPDEALDWLCASLHEKMPDIGENVFRQMLE